jgi:hypothetical protein
VPSPARANWAHEQLATVRKAIDYCTGNLDCVVEDGGAEGPSHAWRVLRTPGPDAFRRSYTEFVDF